MQKRVVIDFSTQLLLGTRGIWLGSLGARTEGESDEGD